MTYPFVFHMHDSLPIHNRDTYEIIAKGWSLREALIQGKDLDHSELIFHPYGLDITLQPQRWSSFPIWTALYTIFGDPLAYNLVALFGILFKAFGMYLLGLYLWRVRIVAWVCGAFYAFAAPSLTMALRNPDTGATEWIPWLILLLVYGVKRLRAGNEIRTTYLIMFIAGLCFSLNVYMHLRIGIFAMLIGGGYIVWKTFADRLWARHQFWLAMLVFSLTASVISAPLLLRTLRSDGYGFAIDRTVLTDSAIDLLNLFSADRDRPMNYRQVIASLNGDQLEVECLCEGISHVGIVAVVFAMMGALYILRFERNQTVWIALTVLSFSLSLGLIFRVDGTPLDIYWTPYRLLQDNFFFRALWAPFRMIIVFVFPFSILIGYGLHSRLRTVKLDLRGKALLTIAVATLLYGTSIFPIPMRDASRLQYLTALEKLPEGAVIDLPMGRQSSTYYMSLQRFHGRPIVEGKLPRTPPDAYDYIESNAILRVFRASSAFKGLENVELSEWQKALQNLLNDGFRYLILHRKLPLLASHSRRLPERFTDVFIFPPPVYQDSDSSIIDLAEWDGPFPVARAGGYTHFPDNDDLNIRVGDTFKLHSWSILDSSDPTPCKSVTVESWWELVKADPGHNTLELILSEEDGVGQIAISKQLPANRHTTDWHMGYSYRDRAELEIPCAIRDGKYLLLLGLIDSVTWESKEFRYPDGNAIGTLYYLTTLNVQAE